MILFGAVTSAPSAARPGTADSSEAALAKLDLEQKDMVAKADVTRLAALSAPGLTINAPTNRVLTREQFLEMMRSGQIGAENFDRTVESVKVSGDVGVVMGSEIFTPTPQSELGRTYGVVPLKRRYTNIYIKDHGSWLWFARHANVVARSNPIGH
ncbi:nuclear transport factor 2 family protein [Novosphingobium sp. 9U]|uniref:nuclear transport factor 2 family protein n=1 Tax=Novosphingobium sp. 9U TaxID=2653158 RepID=UPI0013580CA3|nr:nuclear transport factor 2 family protein [Novosphingobium sp. 9U]